MPIAVLSIPTRHVYVEHLSSPHAPDEVIRLPDPTDTGQFPAAPWWPPPALEADWVRDNRATFDVAHLHFGFDARTPEQLADWVQALKDYKKPLVYTVHDLRNPHHLDPRLHDAQLDVLMPAADAVITLTSGAADVVLRRWGRRARVLPHPHVVPERLLSAARPQRQDFVVGVHLKSLRASIDPAPVLDNLTRVVPDLPDARLRVDVHTDVMEAGMANYDGETAHSLRSLEAEGRIDLHVHDFFSDEEFWAYLLSLDVSVLPYRFGTHSGWLEACFDLGTTVLVSDCGFYQEQRPCLSFHLGPDGPDGASLEDGLLRAYKERPRWRADRMSRRLERAALARAHGSIYRQVLTP